MSIFAFTSPLAVPGVIDIGIPPGPIDLFGLKLHAFGFLVGTAILLGTILAGRRARQLGLSERVVNEVALWAVIPGFIGAHLVHQLFYFPEQLVDHMVNGVLVPGEPLRILEFWNGISSFGGFVGGTLGVVYYFFRRRKRQVPFLPYADAIMYGFAFAWIFGRLGCTVAFDHPGSITDFALGMPYQHCDLAQTVQTAASYCWPVGSPEHMMVNGEKVVTAAVRHNLGFYELGWSIAMAAVFFTQRKRTHFKGWYLAMFVVCYMPVRFFWDFFRAVDVRYGPLTPGQWISIVLMGLGCVVLWKGYKRADRIAPDGVPKPELMPPGEPIAAPAGGGSVSPVGKGAQAKPKKARKGT